MGAVQKPPFDGAAVNSLLCDDDDGCDSSDDDGCDSSGDDECGPSGDEYIPPARKRRRTTGEHEPAAAHTPGWLPPAKCTTLLKALRQIPSTEFRRGGGGYLRAGMSDAPGSLVLNGGASPTQSIAWPTTSSSLS